MPFPFDPDPRTVWTEHRDGREATCAVWFVPNGVQVEIRRGRRLLRAMTFATGDEALAWAEEERERFVTFDPTAPGARARLD